MDEFEEHIRKNRQDLDKYIPSPEIWESIDKDLHRNRSHAFRWVSAAAIIIVVFTTAALFYVGENRKNYLHNKRAVDALFLETDLKLKETEIYYNNLINDLYSQTTIFLTGNPDVREELNNDLSQLDSIYADIKEDLKDNVANQEVIEALINNYRIRIDILENMLSILKQNSGISQNNNRHVL